MGLSELLVSGRKKVNGKVVLCRGKSISGSNRVVDEVNRAANEANRFRDKISECFGRKVSVQLISAADQSCNKQGKEGKKAYLEEWTTKMKSARGGDFVSLKVNFDWDEEMEIPGAFLIRNGHSTNFYLESLTLKNVPGHGRIHFDCNSWIYPNSIESKRIFFVNKAYLPSQTPQLLCKYREDELINLRGDGTKEPKKGERIYDYDVYNDLGGQRSCSKNPRPILGGSSDHPYPRRGRTGRRHSLRDGRCEHRSMSSIYVPGNERFGPSKKVEFVANQLNATFAQLGSSFGPKEFDSFEDVELELNKILQHLTINEESQPIPLPQRIRGNLHGWMLDEEFSREMLAGENPVVICRLQEFPPSSKLDPTIYGDQNSKITKEHLKNSLYGLTIDEAIKQNKLYILDHHDSIIPFLRRINSLSSTKTYATRTLLFPKNDGTLKPLIIELSLPHPRGDQFGAISRVVLPANEGVDASIWQLAKTYVVVNDTGHHQLISHWLNTHAVIEPFVIATNRQLSVLHPIHKLLSPHFKDTMNINALARGSLINADGIIEKTHYPGMYSMEMSSWAYKNWVFPLQALPADLVNRGVAIEDSRFPHGLRLLIEDYPYAVDGLEIWTTIKTWVKEYCSFYYMNDEMICEDIELQSWWKELREKGHEDKKDEPWWPKMQTVKDLVDSCTIIIWIASALHAAVNFGQYSYGRFFPNRPSISNRLLPTEGTPDYKLLELNPEKAFLKTISSQPKDNILVVSIIAILSMHFSDEVYIGERSNEEEWTSDKEPLEAFKRFKRRLAEIEDMIVERNQDPKLKNRVGPVNMPYTLLFPTSTKGITGKGIPNSISI